MSSIQKCQVFTDRCKDYFDLHDKVAKVCLSIINFVKACGFACASMAKAAVTLVGVVMIDDLINPFLTAVNILNGNTRDRTINLMAVQVLNGFKAAEYFEWIKVAKWLPSALLSIPFALIINPLVLSLSLLGIRDNSKKGEDYQKMIADLNREKEAAATPKKKAKIASKISKAQIEKNKAFLGLVAEIGKTVASALALIAAFGLALPALFMASVSVIVTGSLGYRTAYGVWASTQYST